MESYRAMIHTLITTCCDFGVSHRHNVEEKKTDTRVHIMGFHRHKTQTHVKLLYLYEDRIVVHL